MAMATARKHGTGDLGFTGLPGGARVPKTHPRIRFFAALDELGCRLGFARALPSSRGASALLLRFQQALIYAGAQSGDNSAAIKLRAEFRFLEMKTAALETKLPPLREFLLPGSSAAESALHSARAACRQAEIMAWPLPGSNLAAAYLNRLSSCLFALARLSSAAHKPSDQL